MAQRKKKRPGEKGYGKVEFRGFVKRYLKAAEKQHIKANLLSSEDFIEFLEKVTDSGYKFSLSRSADGKTATATAYCTDFTMVNAGLGLSMRHGDTVVAVTSLWSIFALEGYNCDWDEVLGSDEDLEW